MNIKRAIVPAAEAAPARSSRRCPATRAATLCVALATVGAVAPAGATTVGECLVTLDVLSELTAGAEFSSARADRDQAGLLGKVENAALKLDQAKFADSLQKLGDYRDKLGQLVDAAKINAQDGAELLDGLDAATACICQISPSDCAP